MLSLLAALKLSFQGTGHYSIAQALANVGQRQPVPPQPDEVERTPSQPGSDSRAPTIDLTSPNKAVSEVQPDSFLLDQAGQISSYDPVTRLYTL
eukprot:3178913-Rhodomonas_salina.2